MTHSVGRTCVVLPCDPTSASAARRFATGTLHEWVSEDVCDVVELLLSEVVTNALLHAGSDVEVCVIREPDGIRVEVADQSRGMPAQRHWAGDASTGRGLALVDAMASGWGVDHSAEGGKVVWFTVGGPPKGHHFGDFDLDAFDDARPDGGAVELLGTPVLLFGAMHRHLEALMREWALLGARGDDWRPPRLDVDLVAATHALTVAGDAGRSTADVTVRITAPPGDARAGVAALRDSVRDADERARAGALLTPPALPEVRACLEWFLGQVIDQLDGAPPAAWRAPPMAPSAAEPTFDPHAALDAAASATVVADGHNRIVYANAAAEELLGWNPGTLAGQRLTAIIPERLRDAHIAGYSRYQLTRVPRLIGQAVQVPALRRDGTEIEVSLQLSATGDNEATRFVAAIRPVDLPVDMSPIAANQTLHSLAKLNNASVGELLATLARVAGWQVACWWTPDDAVLRCTHVWTDREDAHNEFVAASRAATFSSGVGLPGRVCASGRVLWLPDVVADSNFRRSGAATASGLRSACAFPVGVGEHACVVELFGEGIRPADDDLIAAYTVAGPVLASLRLT